MKTLALLLLAFFACRADASVIRADFTASAGLPYCCTSLDKGPLELKALDQETGNGVELGANGVLTNPSEWNGGIVHIDLDPLAQTVTLLYEGINDFETFEASISNIRFSGAEAITGFRLISNTMFETMVPFERLDPLLSFTGNSLRISLDTREGFYFVDGSAVFAYTTEARQEVPEPATLVLLAIGMAGLLGRRRR